MVLADWKGQGSSRTARPRDSKDITDTFLPVSQLCLAAMSFLRKALPETANSSHESSRDRMVLVLFFVFFFWGGVANNSRIVPGKVPNGPLNRLARFS